MSQKINFSLSSGILDNHRRNEDEESVVDLLGESGYSVEYLSDKGETTEDIYDDIRYMRKLGLKPRSLHLSPVEDLDEEKGAINLNTSVSNSQLAPEEAERSIYWSPETIVLHPPSTNKKSNNATRNMLRNIDEVYDIHEDDSVATPLLIENMPPIGGYLVQEPSDIEKVEEIGAEMNMTDRIQYVVDIGHTKDWREMLEAYPRNRVKEFHIHNKRQRDDGGWENHLPPQTGQYNFEEIIPVITEDFPNADIVVELKPEYLEKDTVEETTEYLEDIL